MNTHTNLKAVLIAMLLMLSCVTLWADCDTAEDCIKDGSFGVSKVNGATRAIYYELKETNRLLVEILNERRKENGTIHSEHIERGQGTNRQDS